MSSQKKLAMRTPSLADKNFAALAALFPNAVTETMDENGAVIRAIDKDVLAQEINAHVVEGREERYQFTWPDKRKSILLANAPIAAALRPCREESVNFDTTENLYIEGDNLDVLKLLRETYLNRVKMIYIDPPYNTGHDFLYEDDFAEETGSFLRRDRQFDEQGNRLSPNFDSNGRFHTDWLNMLYPRLRLCKDLLRRDGAIFISIDDKEVAQLRKICDEIYGESNYIGQICRATGTTTGQDANKIGSSLDYLLVYRKSTDFVLSGVELDDNDVSRFSSEDVRGKYSLLQMRKTGNADRREDRPSMYYPVISPTGVEVYPTGPTGYESRWRFGYETYQNYLAKDMVVWQQSRSGEVAPYIKYYLEGRTKQVSNLWTDLDGNKKGSIELKAVFGEKIFDNPKPTAIIRRIITIASVKEDDVILDFFSGSATTAHAVMQLNAEDGGKRKFIMVQLPEVCAEDSEAAKAGYTNICEIGKERIRRAGAKIKTDSPLTRDGLDLGFRVLKLDSSNMKDVYYTPEEYAKMGFDLSGFKDNIKKDRSDEDLLFQVMLDLGIPLSAKIRHVGDVYYVNDTYLIACFKQVDTALITEIAKQKPYYSVFRDSSFTSDSAMVNFEQVFNTYSPNTIRRVL